MKKLQGVWACEELRFNNIHDWQEYVLTGDPKLSVPSHIAYRLDDGNIGIFPNPGYEEAIFAGQYIPLDGVFKFKKPR